MCRWQVELGRVTHSHLLQKQLKILYFSLNPTWFWRHGQLDRLRESYVHLCCRPTYSKARAVKITSNGFIVFVLLLSIICLFHYRKFVASCLFFLYFHFASLATMFSYTGNRCVFIMQLRDRTCLFNSKRWERDWWLVRRRGEAGPQYLNDNEYKTRSNSQRSHTSST